MRGTNELTLYAGFLLDSLFDPLSVDNPGDNETEDKKRLQVKGCVSQYPEIVQRPHGVRKIDDNIENLLRPDT